MWRQWCGEYQVKTEYREIVQKFHMYQWDLVVRREKRNFIGASARDWGNSGRLVPHTTHSLTHMYMYMYM